MTSVRNPLLNLFLSIFDLFPLCFSLSKPFSLKFQYAASKQEAKASKRAVTIDPPTEEEKFIIPESKRLYRDQRKQKNIVHGRIVEKCSRSPLPLCPSNQVRPRQLSEQEGRHFLRSHSFILCQHVHSLDTQRYRAPYSF